MFEYNNRWVGKPVTGSRCVSRLHHIGTTSTSVPGRIYQVYRVYRAAGHVGGCSNNRSLLAAQRRGRHSCLVNAWKRTLHAGRCASHRTLGSRPLSLKLKRAGAPDCRFLEVFSVEKPCYLINISCMRKTISCAITLVLINSPRVRRGRNRASFMVV